MKKKINKFRDLSSKFSRDCLKENEE